jgi:hypothetical protein
MNSLKEDELHVALEMNMHIVNHHVSSVKSIKQLLRAAADPKT